MSLLRFLGIEREPAEPRRETETVRRIAARLERLDAEQARFLAGFAYVLARVAHADLRIVEAEVGEMQRRVRELAALSEEEAALVVEIARSQARLFAGTENYVVTREFRRRSSPEQRRRLLECLFAVAGADGAISTLEGAEIAAVAEELGFSRPELAALRSAWRDRLAELQSS
jgi:uncharacterized tellurite resistance protein B-like protein